GEQRSLEVAHRLPIGVDPERPLSRELSIAHCLAQVIRVGGLTEMLGELRGVLIEPCRVLRLQGAGDLLVQAQAPGSEDLFVQRLAEERMREPEADLPGPTLVLQHPHPYGLLQRGK